MFTEKSVSHPPESHIGMSSLNLAGIALKSFYKNVQDYRLKGKLKPIFPTFISNIYIQ